MQTTWRGFLRGSVYLNQKRLKIGNSFFYYDVEYIVLELSPPDIKVQREVDNRSITFNYFSLVTDPYFQFIKKIGDIGKIELQKKDNEFNAILDVISEKERSNGSKKYEMIRPLLLLDNIKDGDVLAGHLFSEVYSEYIEEGQNVENISKRSLYQKISKHFGKSVRQIERYYSRYLNASKESNNEGLNGLVRKNSNKRFARKDEIVVEVCHPNNKTIILDRLYLRVDEEFGPIIKFAIEKYYLNKRKISISNLTDNIEILCFEKGLPKLEYDTVYNIINRLDKKIKDTMRIGEAAINEFTETTRGFGNYFAKAPLHIVEIDHTQLDLDIIDADSGQNLGRPWITMGIDVFTRKIWCFHISFDHPSANKVRKALLHGIFLKKAKEKYNTINDWEISGIPKIIYFDNGPEFDNTEVRRMINDTLKSQVMYRPIATPRYGGVIERFFGTLNKQLIHKLAGTRKSNLTELGDYDAENEAILSLKDIEELIATYIVDVYHHKKHKGLPKDYPTPTARYYQGIELAGFPEFVFPHEEYNYYMGLLPTVYRMYNRDGIRLGNRLYNSTESSKLIQNQKS